MKAERSTEGGSTVLAARHDGYARDLGIVHERRWRLAPGGGLLEGEDAFQRVPGLRVRPHEVAVRFHLHPAIAARGLEDGRLELVLPIGEVWHFGAEGADIALEESVYFAGLTGARRTDQIVLYLTATEGARVRWGFVRAPARDPAA